MHWLFTCTTYGTWLPGDPRGSVSAVRDRRPGESFSPTRRRHNRVGQAYDGEMRGLRRAAGAALQQSPFYLSQPMAEAVLRQFLQTADYRRWSLLAAAIMTNHFHLVVEMEAREDQNKALACFKAYATRKLNDSFDQVPHRWTKRGSSRPLPHSNAVEAAVHYVLYKQPYPLVRWSQGLGRMV